ncbi:KAR3 [Candida oxycetoniae]|uniref:Kinesin-like protein n=1 Tax=Candida oxycetoniae TaxID=497107 RepID=A0AAI9SXQ9_9ASCO|nr:KAR3 [Candida oxycetoniae]KAI3404506.2 KAR3 [Candida oxycetoniae]
MKASSDNKENINVVKAGLFNKSSVKSNNLPNSHKMRRLSSRPASQNSNTLCESQKLRSLIYEKQQELDQMNTSSITLRTQIETQILNNFTEESKYLSLERKLSDIKMSIAKLGDYEESSMTELKRKFEINSQEMMMQHKKRLNARKEEIALQIDEFLTKKKSEYLVEIDQLTQQVENIKDQSSRLDQNLQVKINLFQKQHEAQEKQSLDLIKEQIADHEREIETINQSIVTLETATTSFNSKDIPHYKQDLVKYEQILKQLTTKNSEKEQEINNFEQQIIAKKQELSNLESASLERSEESKRMQFEIQRMKSELIGQETKRRVLHSLLQELKGNIRVFCRIRAVPEGSRLMNFALSDDDLNEEGKQELTLTKDNVGISKCSNTTYTFQFDKIFSMTKGNEHIFEEYSQLIQSCIDGQNVCVFAYGQTGSGKTFTMSNPSNGMIPLSIKKIFDDIKELKEQSQQWSYEITGRFVEIYNESIVDLLDPQPGEKHEIKHDDINCKTSVTNIKTVPITSPEQANRLLAQVNSRRSTAATKSNDKSSRSHSIFIMDVNGYNRATKTQTFGTLNLIDLAGSERISVSQVEGERLKETQAINKSLSALGDVISSLNSTQASHIPYRNSKLTYLLKHSLGGNSKTLMFVNVSPLSSDFNETMNSLRFATKVNNTKLG